MKKPVCTLVGLTSREGFQLANQFSRRGFEIAVVCKKGRLFEDFRSFAEHQGFGFRPFFVHSDQPSYIENSIRSIRQNLGETDVLIYNDTVFGRETNYPKYGNQNDIRLNSESAIRAVNEVFGHMSRTQRGMMFFCGEEFSPEFGGQGNDARVYAAKWLTMKVAAELESRNIQVYSCFHGRTHRAYDYNKHFSRQEDFNEIIRKSKTAYVYDNEKFYLNENWFNQNQRFSGREYPVSREDFTSHSGNWQQEFDRNFYQERRSYPYARDYGQQQPYYGNQMNRMYSDYPQHSNSGYQGYNNQSWDGSGYGSSNYHVLGPWQNGYRNQYSSGNNSGYYGNDSSFWNSDSRNGQDSFWGGRMPMGGFESVDKYWQNHWQGDSWGNDGYYNDSRSHNREWNMEREYTN